MADRVAHRIEDAVIRRQSPYEQAVDAGLFQTRIEVGVFECGVGVAFRFGGFADDDGIAQIQSGGELRSVSFRHAMRRPRASLLGKRAVIGGMPVAAGEYGKVARAE